MVAALKSRSNVQHAPQDLDLLSIEPHPDNPRDDFADNDPELVALAASLSGARLLQPISVIPAGDGQAEKFRIVCGERRWRAARLAGWKSIPAFVHDVSPQEAVRLMVEENLNRKDLNPIELARALALLARSTDEGGPGLTHQQIAERFGHRGPWASCLIKLLRLPAEWQREVAAGELEPSAAVKLADFAERPEVLGAVKVDRERNPDDWRGRSAFFQQLEFVVGRLDGKPLFDPNAGRPKGSVRRQTVGAEPPGNGKTLPRRSVPIEHDQAELDPVAEIVALIPQLKTQAQIEHVERALRKRELALA